MSSDCGNWSATENGCDDKLLGLIWMQIKENENRMENGEGNESNTL